MALGKSVHPIYFRKKFAKLIALIIIGIIIIGVLLDFSSSSGLATSAASDLYNFGNTVTSNNIYNNCATAKSISYFTCHNNGSLSVIIAYFRGTSSGNAIAALYEVSEDSVFVFLAKSISVGIGTSFSWVDFRFPSTYIMTLGETYAIAIMGNIPLNIVQVGTTGTNAEKGEISITKGFGKLFGMILESEITGAMNINTGVINSSKPTQNSFSTLSLIPSLHSTPTLIESPAQASTIKSQFTISPIGIITGFEVDRGGSGYTTPHVVISGGGGSGAAAVARVSQGVVIGVVLNNPGSGYTSVPSVTLRDPSPRAKGAIITAKIATYPSSLMVWTDGTHYYANSTRSTIFLGGSTNINNINGLSFGDVLGNSTQIVKNVTILSGNYIQDKPVYVWNNTIINGQGNSTFIKMAQGVPSNINDNFLINDYPRTVSNVTIANMWLDGNINNAFHDSNGIAAQFTNNLWVHNITFTNYNLTTSQGIDIAWTSNVTIENSIFDNCQAAGIWVDIGSVDYMVRNNYMPNDNIALVFFDNYGNHTGTVTGNVMDYLGLYCPGYSPQPYGVTITNNIITTPRTSPNPGAIWIYGFSNCTLENNIVENSPVAGISLLNSHNIVIKNNTLLYNGWQAIYVDNSPNQCNLITLNDLRYNGYGPISDNIATTQDTVIHNLAIDGFPISSLSLIMQQRLLLLKGN